MKFTTRVTDYKTMQSSPGEWEINIPDEEIEKLKSENKYLVNISSIWVMGKHGHNEFYPL